MRINRAGLCLLVIAFALLPSYGGSSGLTVHEWGTFTSFQGGDGNLMMWQPLQSSRLPNFVYNTSMLPQGSPFAVTGKGALTTLVRLETPVVYFYSDHAMTEDVAVKFPNGWITEWFPQASGVGSFTPQTKGSSISWSNIALVPENQSKNALRELKPAESGDHYFNARETDSDFVRCSTNANTPAETEKFLFYRGAGNIATPLRVTMSSGDVVTLSNTGKETISHLFVFESDKSAAGYVAVRDLKPGQSRVVASPRCNKVWGNESKADSAEKLARTMARSLAQSGLYPREARAMVNTWKDSWFTEEGMRVFYLLPRGWTDQILPMSLNPAPENLVRVMVGRAEVFTPDLEQQLVANLEDAREGDAAASNRTRQIVKSLGRFAVPAFYRAVARTDSKPEQMVKLMNLLYASLPSD